ncbi:MAG: hypothetical protein U0S48_05720 [Solirubrobacteraceae bacterium]
MQLRLVDAVGLDVVLPAVHAVGDLRQQLGLDRRRALVEDGLERRLERVDAVALGELGDAPRSRRGRVPISASTSPRRWSGSRELRRR